MYTDKELISRALNHWANYIETGNVILSRDRARSMNKEYNQLTHEQVNFVERLRILQNEVLGE
jgi:hypothetical protein